MRYQLVLQLPFNSKGDHDLLMELEETITDGLGNSGSHDWGSGEMNIFIHTDEPTSAFERAHFLIQGKTGLEQLTAGYGDFDEDDYVPVYPKGLKCFFR
jgi:hypothetical protein